MGLFRKKADPISERARALNQEIAVLEAQIKTLDSKLQQRQDEPRLRSTAWPAGENATRTSNSPPAEPTPAHDPIFVEVDRGELQARLEGPSTPEHYNELGVRKYDLPALWHRLRNHLRGPSTTNPRLVSYLAAGGIQGLRPLRYEKRVARNRFIVLVVVFFVILLGLVCVFVRQAH